MAISAIYYQIIRAARLQRVLPVGGSLLELGEANWYGDLSLDALRGDVEEFVTDAGERRALLATLEDTASPTYRFDISKVFYRVFFAATQVDAIDRNGSPQAKRLDLNHPVKLDRTYDAVVNNGTAEHVFNIGQFFKTMHDHVRVGGLMIHESPLTGWFDHGFYNLQPTVYYDLAAANQYRLKGMFCCRHVPQTVVQIHHPSELVRLAEKGEVAGESILICLLRKEADVPFGYPMQGYFAGTVDAEQIRAWRAR